MSVCLECNKSIGTHHDPACGQRVKGCPEVVQDDCSHPGYVTLAQEQYGCDGECEIDDNATVSLSEDQDGILGAYVHAWVFVYNPERTAL